MGGMRIREPLGDAQHSVHYYTLPCELKWDLMKTRSQSFGTAGSAIRRAPNFDPHCIHIYQSLYTYISMNRISLSTGISLVISLISYQIKCLKRALRTVRCAATLFCIWLRENFRRTIKFCQSQRKRGYRWMIWQRRLDQFADYCDERTVPQYRKHH